MGKGWSNSPIPGRSPEALRDLAPDGAVEEEAQPLSSWQDAAVHIVLGGMGVLIGLAACWISFRPTGIPALRHVITNMVDQAALFFGGLAVASVASAWMLQSPPRPAAPWRVVTRRVFTRIEWASLTVAIRLIVTGFLGFTGGR